MYKEDMALTKLQWLLCHKIKSNQTKYNIEACISLEMTEDCRKYLYLDLTNEDFG